MFRSNKIAPYFYRSIHKNIKNPEYDAYGETRTVEDRKNVYSHKIKVILKRDRAPNQFGI